MGSPKADLSQPTVTSPWQRWLVPLALLVITVETIAAIIAGTLVEGFMDGLTGWLSLAALCVVAVAGLLIVRLQVLPSVFGQLRGEEVSPLVTGQRPLTIDSPFVLSFVFSVSPATYGLVAAIVNGNPWFALPLSAIALVSLAVNSSYTHKGAAELRRYQQAHGY